MQYTQTSWGEIWERYDNRSLYEFIYIADRGNGRTNREWGVSMGMWGYRQRLNGGRGGSQYRTYGERGRQREKDSAKIGKS